LKTLNLKTDKLFTNINAKIEELLPPTYNGLVHVFCPHSTAAIFLLEDEILHLVDVRFFLDKLAPYSKESEGPHKNQKYLHDLISLRSEVPPDERVNGHSHIRSLFFNTSELIPVQNGRLITGEFQRLFFVELDPIRERKLYLNLIETMK
jgi:thiamine phosphate synthase YjbQ (UPF0047 family)